MRRIMFSAAVAAAFGLVTSATPLARHAAAAGAVYTATNSAAGNAVLLFDRAADGGVRAAPDRDLVLLSRANDGPVRSDTEYRAGGVMP